MTVMCNYFRTLVGSVIYYFRSLCCFFLGKCGLWYYVLFANQVGCCATAFKPHDYHSWTLDDLHVTLKSGWFETGRRTILHACMVFLYVLTWFGWLPFDWWLLHFESVLCYRLFNFAPFCAISFWCAVLFISFLFFMFENVLFYVQLWGQVMENWNWTMICDTPKWLWWCVRVLLLTRANIVMLSIYPCAYCFSCI